MKLDVKNEEVLETFKVIKLRRMFFNVQALVRNRGLETWENKEIFSTSAVRRVARLIGYPTRSIINITRSVSMEHSRTCHNSRWHSNVHLMMI